MIKSFILVGLLVGFVSAGKVNFKDCGNHEVISLDISDCSGNSCIYHRGKPYTMTADFNANQNSKAIQLKVTANINGAEVPVPGVDPDGCKATKCPLVKGQKFELTNQGVVPKALPNGKVVITAKLTGDSGQLACLSYNAEIQD